MRIAFLTIAVLALTATSREIEKDKKDEDGAIAEAPPGPAPSDFIRLDRSEEQALLQTANTTYQKEGLSVTLIGAIHIADEAYFDALNKHFKNYDRLLFEMIGGDQLAELQKQKAEGQEAESSPLNLLYQLSSSFLELETQKEGIDYTAGNFVHADLTLAEFKKLQEKRNESLLSFALANHKNAEVKNSPSVLTLTGALLSGNSDKVKSLFAGVLATGDELAAKNEKPSVIITDRNAKVIQVLNAEIKNDHRELGIFYGAAHFPDMETSLLKLGYKKTKQEWFTAWSFTHK